MRRLNVRVAVRVGLVAAVLAIAAFAFRAALLRGAASAVLGIATGDTVAMDGLTVSPSRVVVTGLRVRRGGDPLVTAARIEVRYDLHDLVFGGGRRYGLAAIAVDRPALTIVRHADGGFNVGGAVARGAGGPPGGASGGAAPLRFTLTVRGGRVSLDDPFRVLPVARRLTLDGIVARAEVDDGGVTRYRGSGRVADDAAQAVAFAGRIGADGYALHRLRVRALDLPPVVDYFVNAPSAALLHGRARALDLRVYAFPARGGAAYHLAGTADVAGGVMRVPGLVVPATDMRGRLDAYDDGLVSPRLDARLGASAVRLAGGLFDWRAPVFRLGIASATDLADARALFRFSKRLPLRGPATISTLLEGPVGTPVAATRVTSASLAYGTFPVTAATGRAIYAAGDVDVVGAHGTYGGLDVRADGAIVLGTDGPATQLVVDASGPAAAIPYAAQVAPGATLHATGLLAGPGLRLDARGVADGAGAGTRLAGSFHVDPDGDGAFGPLAVERDDGARLGGTFYLDRAHDRSGFWLDARDYPFADLGTRPRLPGLALAAPVFSGRLDGAIAGTGPPSAFRLAGRVRGRGVRVGSVAIDDVSGNVAGAFGNVRLGGVAASGPWGSFHGDGAYASERLALTGAYAGSLERLRAFTGDVGASGTIAGPVALLIEPGRTVVQTRGAGGPNVRVRGVPVDGVAGTLAVAGRRLRIYAATATVADGGFAAAGDPASADGVGVSVAGADLAHVPAIGPLRSGRLSAIGSVTSPAGAGRFAGGVALGRSSVAGMPVSGNGEIAVGGGRAAFARTDALAGPAFGSFGGAVAGVGTRTPTYDVDVRLPSVALGAFARLVAPGRTPVVMGTLDADLRVRGSAGGTASVDGTIAVPEGSVNGLNFSEGAAHVSIGPEGIRARDGHVTVGSTDTSFSGLVSAAGEDFHVSSARADLADFNDYFDAGDTLGGRGRVAVRFSQRRGSAARTDADIAIAGLRYRRFDLGDARAAWHSNGRDVTGAIDFGGPSGRLDASGVLVLPARAASGPVLLRSRFDGRARLQDLDLGVWLPALGIAAPIGGRVDATATIAGPLRDPAVTTVATLADGSIGKFPVDRFAIEAVSTLDRTTLRRLELDLPSISIVGTGQFGLDARAPVALALHAESPNLGALSTRLFGVAYPVTGAGSADLTIDGTRANPRVAGTAAVRSATIRGVEVAGASAAFSLRGRDVVLSNAKVQFATGSVSLDGSVPLEIQPFAIGPSGARVALTLAADDVELADFATLLPAGSVLRGRIDGTLQIGGTAGAPHLGGRLALTKGIVQTPFERVALTDVGAVVRLDGDAARLDSLEASAGGGRIDASGSIRVPDLVHPGTDAAYDVVARADKLHLDLPTYGSGTIDGTLSLSRIAGGIPSVAGDLRLSDGTIPFSALLLAGAGGGGGFDASAASAQTTQVAAAPDAAATPAPAQALALNLDVSADRNVRVRSANVDIGGRGDLHIGGTRAAPSLSGGFTSTGGTVTYFNTVFRLIDGTVTFVPDLGVIPTLDARAITHVINPDPNTVRNAAGTADVTLTLAGPVNGLTIGLSSDPSYDRQQILGLLLNAPALGASNLFGENRDQATLYGSNATSSLPPGVAVFRSQAGELSVAQEAFGVANAQFTRTLLAPIETTFANAVGLSNFNVNVDYTGNVGVSARKVLGKKINAIYGSTFGYPYRQTFGFEFKPNVVTAAQVTVFQSLGVNGLNSLTPTYFITNTTNAKLGAAQPPGGTTGFSLSLQRLF